jgi:hypothetical protein
MILKASQRSGARQLAAHLMNDRDNDHVTLHELRGFMAADLQGALSEAEAIAKGTRCIQYMFSLSLNPPKNGDAGIDRLMNGIDRAEAVLDLTGQPRAIVIHEKNGRRHAHVVWSRIDADEMKAINMPHFKNRLCGLSKELYLEHGWELPDGHKMNGWKNPLNFTLAEWQQAKRLDLDPREIKQVFQAAWERSDNPASFRNALEEHGYFLAQGDRRGVVALNVNGDVFSVARFTGIKTKALNEKLGKPEVLHGVDEARNTIRERLGQKLRQHLAEDKKAKLGEIEPLLAEVKRTAILQRTEREKLSRLQEQRWKTESKTRGERFRRGLGAVLDVLSGRLFTTRRQNDSEAFEGFLRDRAQREELFEAQARESKPLHDRIERMRMRHRDERVHLAHAIGGVLKVRKLMRDSGGRTRGLSL